MKQADDVKTKQDAIKSMAALIEILKNIPGIDRGKVCQLEGTASKWPDKCEAEVMFLFARVKVSVDRFIQAALIRGTRPRNHPTPEYMEPPHIPQQKLPDWDKPPAHGQTIAFDMNLN